MRGDSWPAEHELADDDVGPEISNAPLGFASLPPLLRALLRAVAQRWHGTLLIRDASQQLIAAVSCRAGFIVAARVNGFTDLFHALTSLCERVVPARISLLPGVDLSGVGGNLLTSHVDPWRLTAAVIREAIADDCVAEAVRAIGAKPIKLRANVSLARYAFSALEAALVDVLESEPSTLHELAQRSALARESLHRLVCTLWVTHAVTLAPPAWLRIVSTPVAHAPASTVSAAHSRNDERTAVVRLDTHTLDMTAALGGREAAREHESGMTPARRARTLSSYHVLAPSNGVTEVSGLAQESRSSGPRAGSTFQPSRNQADEHFRIAEFLATRGYPREAVFEAQKALRLCAPRPEQQALYAWLLHQRSGGASGVAANVWELIEVALRADPDDARVLHFSALLSAAAKGETESTLPT